MTDAEQDERADDLTRPGTESDRRVRPLPGRDERRYLAAIEDAKQNPLDETVEGGNYILAGHLVNAFGEAITEPEPGP